LSVKLEKGSGPLGDIGVDDFVLTQGTCKYLILINIHDQWNLKFNIVLHCSWHSVV
jgi:hypothetical protein